MAARFASSIRDYAKAKTKLAGLEICPNWTLTSWQRQVKCCIRLEKRHKVSRALNIRNLNANISYWGTIVVYLCSLSFSKRTNWRWTWVGSLDLHVGGCWDFHYRTLWTPSFWIIYYLILFSYQAKNTIVIVLTRPQVIMPRRFYKSRRICFLPEKGLHLSLIWSI